MKGENQMNTKITELEQEIKFLKEQIAAINQNTFEIGGENNDTR